MKDTKITLTGNVLVEDIVTALEPTLSEDALTKLNDELAGQMSQRISFDDCEVLAYEAVDALDDAGKLPEREGLTDTLNERDVVELAEAIRCGDRATAEHALDALFANDGEARTIRDWIDRGRYSKKARDANPRKSSASALRSVA